MTTINAARVEAHRALELLEDYHSRLGGQQDRALRIAIERVIRIFKSRLFQALLGEYRDHSSITREKRRVTSHARKVTDHENCLLSSVFLHYKGLFERFKWKRNFSVSNETNRCPK